MFDFFKKFFSSEIEEVPSEVRQEGLPPTVVTEVPAGGEVVKKDPRPVVQSRSRTSYTKR